MAIVKMTPDVITSIVAKVRQLHDVDRAKIDNTLPAIPKDMGAQMYNLLMPLEDQKKVLDLLPFRLQYRQTDMALKIVPYEVSQDKFCTTLWLQLPADALMFPAGFDRFDEIPGTTRVVWDRNTLTLYLKEDWSDLNVNKETKDYIQNMVDLMNAHNVVTKASKAAATTMREFLEQHKTVQSALKEAGPALKGYFDPWLQTLLDRVTPKRVRRTKEQKEKVVVNINKLIAKVTTNQLNIE